MTADRVQATRDAFEIGTALDNPDHAEAAAHVAQLVGARARHELYAIIYTQHRIIRALLDAIEERTGLSAVECWRGMASDYARQLAERS